MKQYVKVVVALVFSLGAISESVAEAEDVIYDRRVWVEYTSNEDAREEVFTKWKAAGQDPKTGENLFVDRRNRLTVKGQAWALCMQGRKDGFYNIPGPGEVLDSCQSDMIQRYGLSKSLSQREFARKEWFIPVVDDDVQRLSGAIARLESVEEELKQFQEASQNRFSSDEGEAAIASEVIRRMEKDWEDQGLSFKELHVAVAKIPEMEVRLNDVTEALSALTERLEVVEEGVNTNAEAIGVNVTAIATNADGVKTNATRMQTNSDNIGSLNDRVADVENAVSLPVLYNQVKNWFMHYPQVSEWYKEGENRYVVYGVIGLIALVFTMLFVSWRVAVGVNKRKPVDVNVDVDRLAESLISRMPQQDQYSSSGHYVGPQPVPTSVGDKAA